MFMYFWCFIILHVTSSNDLNKEVADIESGDFDIQQICQLLQVPMRNCSCDIFTINNTNEFQSLCILEKKFNKKDIKWKTDQSLLHIYASITMLVTFVGILGNTAVIISTYSNRKACKMPNCKLLIALLALSDFFFAVMNFFLALPKFWTKVWLYGVLLCKLLKGSSVLGSNISITFISMIAIERYLGILYPLKKYATARLFYILTSSLVVVAILSAIPLWIVYDVGSGDVCDEWWPNNFDDRVIYDWFLMIVYFVIPVVIIASLYCRITIHLSYQATRNPFLNNNEKEKKRRLKDNQKIMKILISILLAFIVCVFTNRFALLYLSIRRNKVNLTTYNVLSYMTLLPYPFQVAVNPIIYSMVDKTWRKNIMKLFVGQKNIKQHRGTIMTSVATRTMQQSK